MDKSSDTMADAATSSAASAAAAPRDAAAAAPRAAAAAPAAEASPEAGQPAAAGPSQPGQQAGQQQRRGKAPGNSKQHTAEELDWWVQPGGSSEDYSTEDEEALGMETAPPEFYDPAADDKV